MVIGIVIWGLLLGACAVSWGRSRRRARTEPPARTPQDIYDDTDPAYRGGLPGVGFDGGFSGGGDGGGGSCGDGGGGSCS